jgi:hypothetical protein
LKNQEEPGAPTAEIKLTKKKTEVQSDKNMLKEGKNPRSQAT